MNRRRFAVVSLLSVLAVATNWSIQAIAAEEAVPPSRPNVLWITSEDNGPHLGCYGDAYSTTPNLDRLAARGLIYWNCWSNAPVCAPARTTLISGLYPTSTGAEHMRSMTRLPVGFLMYPQYLRAAGYYCTNNSKEDYNLAKPGQVWDESSGKAHWKNRRPGQPFFAVFNHTGTHESQVRRRPHKAMHDPAKVRVPAYHPDAPEVQQDWAQYYDNLTEMDTAAGKLLQELADAGLADDTVVFYYADHGPGLPRCKRSPCNSGLRVPLIVHIPEKFRHLASADYKPGGRTERLVSFIDFAPTLLSLCGIEPPAHFQGHAFLGQFTAPPQPFLHGFRGRMDERCDMIRSVRDERYVYIRNYAPHLPCGQHVAYMFQTPTTQVWKRLFDEGKLNAAQAYFWQPKAREELYDLTNDPDEVHNLAGSTEHQVVLKRLRAAQQDFALKIRDAGFLPEDEIHRRSQGSTPYEFAHDAEKYPLERILKTAEAAASLAPEATGSLNAACDDADPAVRYWAAMGLLMRGQDAVAAGRASLEKMLADECPSVRIAAAHALARHGDEADLAKALPVLVEHANVQKHGVYQALASLNAIDLLDSRAASVLPALRSLPTKAAGVDGRMQDNVPRLLEKTLADLQSQ